MYPTPREFESPDRSTDRGPPPGTAPVPTAARHVVRRKKSSYLGDCPRNFERLLRAEKEILADLVTVERDRIALLTELGEILGHESPARLRIAQLVLHTSADARDELLELRYEFRDIADEMDTLSGVDPIFSRHHAGQIRMYLNGVGQHDAAELVAAASSGGSPNSAKAEGLPSSKGDAA